MGQLCDKLDACCKVNHGLNDGLDVRCLDLKQMLMPRRLRRGSFTDTADRVLVVAEKPEEVFQEDPSCLNGARRLKS